MCPFTNPLIIGGLANSIFIGITSSILTLLFAVGLAYAMVNGNKLVIALTAFLLLIGENMIGQYLQIRAYNLVDTVWAVVLSNTMKSCLYAFFLFLCFGGFQHMPFKAFIKKALPGSILLLSISFARFYGETVPFMLYLRNRENYPVSLHLREILLMGEEISVSTIVLLSIPVIIVAAGVAAAFWFSTKREGNLRFHKI